MEKYFYSFNDYLREKFGCRIHRISLDAGFSCPNRDGTLDSRGCIFCNEKGFSAFAGSGVPIREQLEQSMRFTRERFKAEKFIAYFQNGTNTYGDAKALETKYGIVRAFPDIVGLFISTRPDCIDGKKLDIIERYAEDYEVWVEFGVQTIHDRTLRAINRSHTFEQTLSAIEETAKRKIKVAAHIILGLPGETRDDIMATARAIAELPVSGIKLHLLHVLKDTKLEKMFLAGRVRLMEEGEYARCVCDFLEVTNPRCVIFRLVSDAKPDILVSPLWINNKPHVIESIKQEFKRRGTSQGARYENKADMRVRKL